jgi:hypothetical protein
MYTIDILELAKWATAIMAIVGLCAWLKKAAQNVMKPMKEAIESAEKSIVELSVNIDRHNEAIRAVLKNSITRAHREFDAEGKIGRYALQSALDMYEQYKALGGNSFVDEIALELKDLPIDTGSTGGPDNVFQK